MKDGEILQTSPRTPYGCDYAIGMHNLGALRSIRGSLLFMGPCFVTKIAH